MHRVIFTIPKIGHIYSYGFMIMVAFLVGLILAWLRSRKLKLDPNIFLDMGIFGIVGGIIGARLYFVIAYAKGTEQAGGGFMESLLILNPAEPFFTGQNVFAAIIIYILGIVLGVACAHLIYSWLTSQKVYRLEKGKRKLVMKKGEPTRFRVAARVFMVIFLSYFFARGLYILIYHTEYDLAVLNVRSGGLVMYGGLVGGVLFTIIYVKTRNIAPLILIEDVAAVSLAFGLFFGRIGCFLNGCCFGRIAENLPFPLAAAFPKTTEGVADPGFVFQQHLDMKLIDPSATASLPVYATQLYEAAGMLIVAGLLMLFYRYRGRRVGDVFLGLVIGYPVVRFIVEFWRGDLEPKIGGSWMSVPQALSIAVVVLTILYIIFLRNRFSPKTWGEFMDARTKPVEEE